MRIVAQRGNSSNDRDREQTIKEEAKSPSFESPTLSPPRPKSGMRVRKSLREPLEQKDE